MRTGNPVLKENTFKQMDQLSGSSSMTINGTVNKCFALLILCILAATISWRDEADQSSLFGFVVAGGLSGLVLAIVTAFKKAWSPITAPLYALAQGLMLGAVSSMYEMQYPGIVMNAVFYTFATLAALLFAYKSKIIKATENFKLGVVSATGAIALVYFASFILSFLGIKMPFLHDSSMLGIGISIFIVIVAALNLVLDFDFIEKGAKQQAPKYMEWYGAFGLIVTLVWLYLEILRLLAKTQRRR